jgi:hypothetical protein
MIKQANKGSLMALQKYYDRYFIISPELKLCQILSNKESELSAKVYQTEIICIRDISMAGEETDCPYKYWFTLVTTSREYKLFAPTAEERDLWVECFYRFLFVRIDSLELKVSIRKNTFRDCI